RATALALIAMGAMILASDRILWRPLIVWVQRYRVDDSATGPEESSWLLDLVRHSMLFGSHKASALWRAPRRARAATVPLRRGIHRARRILRPRPPPVLLRVAPWALRGMAGALLLALTAGAGLGIYRVGGLLVTL